MPSSKRKPRRKAANVNEASEIELPDTSPTRPSAKKRKVCIVDTNPPLSHFH